MGSFNMSCSISGKPIEYGERCMVWLVAKPRATDQQVYQNWQPMSPALFAVYDDSGHFKVPDQDKISYLTNQLVFKNDQAKDMHGVGQFFDSHNSMWIRNPGFFNGTDSSALELAEVRVAACLISVWDDLIKLNISKNSPWENGDSLKKALKHTRDHFVSLKTKRPEGFAYHEISSCLDSYIDDSSSALKPISRLLLSRQFIKETDIDTLNDLLLDIKDLTKVYLCCSLIRKEIPPSRYCGQEISREIYNKIYKPIKKVTCD